MAEYRAHTRVPQTAPATPRETESAFGLDDLAEQYGVEDLMNFTDNSTPLEQSIDEEFAAYVTAPLSPKKTDILKFWEVSISNYDFNLCPWVDDVHSSTKQGSQHCMQSHLTICQSKPQQCLASACFHQVQRQIRGDETASIQS